MDINQSTISSNCRNFFDALLWFLWEKSSLFLSQQAPKSC